MSTTADTAPRLAGKYLTVLLADESYAIAALKVREIIRLQKITPVPQLPEFVRGVINLRGRVIPVIDLRIRFGLPGSDTAQACIVVVRVTRPDRAEIPLGLVVDAVEEVATLGAAEIVPPPSFGLALKPEYILGMAKVRGQVKLLLDIDHALTSGETSALATVTA